MFQTAPPSQLYLRHITRSIDVNDRNPSGHNIESLVLLVAIVLGFDDTGNRQTSASVDMSDGLGYPKVTQRHSCATCWKSMPQPTPISKFFPLQMEFKTVPRCQPPPADVHERLFHLPAKSRLCGLAELNCFGHSELPLRRQALRFRRPQWVSPFPRH